jgi:hypothetical protein
MLVFFYRRSSGVKRGYVLDLDEEGILDYIRKVGFPVRVSLANQLQNENPLASKCKYAILILD